ncbi:MAG TPA: hypothetical protein VJR92_05560 [Gemmatimonadaceae bacterium]|nr:hypothetical protein [Gemmatimonadaceae bacterium]
MTTEPLTPFERRARFVGVGCLMTVLGFFSMAMVGVLVSAAVAAATKAPSCQDIPACDWYIYAGFGGLLGAITLPILVLRRLGKPQPGGDETSKP